MRYTRHDLKQDKFKETATEAVTWTVEHRQKIINLSIALGAILVVVVAGLWYTSYRGAQAKNALGNAMVIYNAPVVPPGTPVDPQITTFQSDEQRATAAKSAFYEVSSKYGSTKSGKYAHYFAALCEMDLGNDKVAEDQLKSVADVHDNDLATLAKFALASVYRNEGRTEDAMKTYQDLINRPSATVPKATAQLELADLYSAKQPDEAKKLYEQITKDDPKSGAAEIAQGRMGALNK